MSDYFIKKNIIFSADIPTNIYIGGDELESLKHFVLEGNKRLDTVNRLASKYSLITASAISDLLTEQPQLTVSGASACTNSKIAACLRDLEIILRCITYAMFAGDASVLYEYCLNGLAETYQALGVPCNSVAAAIEKMKEMAITIANDPKDITQGDCSGVISELAGYFDDAITALKLIQSKSELVKEKSSISDDSPVFSAKTALKDTKKMGVDLIKQIDYKDINAWIEETDSKQEIETLIVEKPYTLNLKVCDPKEQAINKNLAKEFPDDVFDRLKLKKGLDTEWVVSSSTVQLAAAINTKPDLTTTKITKGTVWAAKFPLYIPIYGDSAEFPIQIVPKTIENTSLSVLIYAYGDLYRKFDIEFNVVSSKSEPQYILAH